MDSDQLVEEGKWLTPSDQAKLSNCLRKFFSKDCLNPKGPILTDVAWKFQGHFLLHLFNDNVIAVPRSEVLGSLRRGTTCIWEEKAQQWIFKVSLTTAGLLL